MKNFRYGVLFLAIVGIVLVSCKKEIEIELENKIILNQEGENKFNYNFDIISIEPISGDISKYEEKYNETIQLLGYNIDFNESKIVTYTNSDVIAIYTPIIDIENPSLKSDLLILESENELLDFELIITETSLNDSISRYLYSTLYGEFIIQFDVRLSVV